MEYRLINYIIKNNITANKIIQFSQLPRLDLCIYITLDTLRDGGGSFGSGRIIDMRKVANLLPN